MACNVLEIAALLAVVRDGAHRALRVEPFDTPRAVCALARVVPEAGIRAAEAEHRVLRALERDVVDVGDHDLADIAASIDPKASLALAPRRIDADLRAVQEPLDERQEGHELAIRALAEVFGVALELFDELAPRMVA